MQRQVYQELPPKIEEVKKVAFTEKQKNIYSAVLSSSKLAWQQQKEREQQEKDTEETDSMEAKKTTKVPVNLLTNTLMSLRKVTILYILTQLHVVTSLDCLPSSFSSVQL
jgi:SNF2 family DNA or RNA helicase